MERNKSAGSFIIDIWLILIRAISALDPKFALSPELRRGAAGFGTSARVMAVKYAYSSREPRGLQRKTFHRKSTLGNLQRAC